MRRTNIARYEYDEGVLCALRAVVNRMEQGESLLEAVQENHNRGAFGGIAEHRYEGITEVLGMLETYIMSRHHALDDRVASEVKGA